MAKISHDDTSWRAEGLKKRYEDWEKPPTPEQRKKHSKKRSSRWCKGQENREHQWAMTTAEPYTKTCSDTSRNRMVCRWSHKHEAEKYCTRCKIKEKDLPRSVRKEIHIASGELTKQEALELQWCQEGHLWDWVDSSHPVFKEINKSLYWLTGYYSHAKVCIMCGKDSGKRKKESDQ